MEVGKKRIEHSTTEKSKHRLPIYIIYIQLDVHRRSQDSALLAVKERNRPVGELLKSWVNWILYMYSPFPKFLICCSILKRIYLYRKAFDFLNKMRYILWVVALLKAYDVTNNGRHLGFFQELEIRLKRREMVIFCCLHKN